MRLFVALRLLPLFLPASASFLSPPAAVLLLFAAALGADPIATARLQRQGGARTRVACVVCCVAAPRPAQTTDAHELPSRGGRRGCTTNTQARTHARTRLRRRCVLSDCTRGPSRAARRMQIGQRRSAGAGEQWCGSMLSHAGLRLSHPCLHADPLSRCGAVCERDRIAAVRSAAVQKGANCGRRRRHEEPRHRGAQRGRRCVRDIAIRAHGSKLCAMRGSCVIALNPRPDAVSAARERDPQGGCANQQLSKMPRNSTRRNEHSTTPTPNDSYIYDTTDRKDEWHDVS